jgi:serine/threonine-protein kinase HipA
MSPLSVWWQQQCVGTIRLGGLGRMEFRYAAEWLENQAAYPISVSLPLQAETHGESAHRFFANLLPGADVRDRLCRRLKVTLGNDLNCCGSSAANVPEH